MTGFVASERCGCGGGFRHRRPAALAVAAAALFLAMSSPAAAQPVQWVGNGHYYELVTDQVTWTAANAAASAATYQGLQGHLATIGSQAENDFIRGNVAVNELAWIGFTDEAQEGDFRWVTGEPPIYTNWADGEPNNADLNEHYAEFIGFFGDGQGEWNDISNDNGGGRYYVIEYQEVVGSIPTLTQVGLLLLGLAVLVLGVRRLA